MSDNDHDFFEDEDEGIFQATDGPKGSYGDPDAIEDLLGDRTVSAFTFGPAGDGLSLPAPIHQPDITNISANVSDDTMVCVCGPCKHYIECINYLDASSDNLITQTHRFCNKLRSWAEPMRLQDVNILACSSYEPCNNKLDKVKSNKATIDSVNKTAIESNYPLGICHAGACEHYSVVVVKYINSSGLLDVIKRRYCTKLIGAGRINLLSYKPAIACTSLKSSLKGKEREALLEKNNKLITENRAKFSSFKEGS